MKTTIDIPDHLYREAKIRAVENGKTLRKVVLEALEEALSGKHEIEEGKTFHERRKLLPGFAEIMNREMPEGQIDSTHLISEDRDSRENALL